MESGRGVITVFFLFCGVRRRSGVSVSLSVEVIEEVERRRELVKRSTCFESLIRRALGLEPEYRVPVVAPAGALPAQST